MPLLQLYVLKDTRPSAYFSCLPPFDQKFLELYEAGILNCIVNIYGLHVFKILYICLRYFLILSDANLCLLARQF